MLDAKCIIQGEAFGIEALMNMMPSFKEISDQEMKKDCSPVNYFWFISLK